MIAASQVLEAVKLYAVRSQIPINVYAAATSFSAQILLFSLLWQMTVEHEGEAKDRSPTTRGQYSDLRVS